MVHVTLLLSTVIASFRKNKKLWLIAAFGILLIFAALRYDFGNDYVNYYRNFILIHSGGSSSMNEPIFRLVVQLCPSFYIFIAITSVFTILPVYYLIKHYVNERYWWLSVLIYCINPYLFLMSLSSIRQIMALSFFIIAVHFSLKHRLLPYLVFVALAAMCHISAIILVPFYMVANDKKVSKTQIITVIVFLLIIIFSANLFDSLLQYGLDFFDIPNYEYYTTLGSNTVRATLLSAIYLIYISINIPRLSGTTLAFSKLSVIGYIFAILAFRVSMITRLQMYFDIFSIITIPMIMYQSKTDSNSKNKIFYMTNKYVLPMLIFTIYILRYYSFFTNPLWASFLKYHTILSVI